MTADGDIRPPPVFADAFRQRFGELIAWRRDVRRFKADPVQPDVIEALLDAANLAPSVGNSQPWRWVQVTSEAAREGVVCSFEAANAAAAETYRDDEKRKAYLALKLAGLKEAPVQFAVFCDEDTSQGARLGRLTMPEMLAYSTVCSVHTFWLAARAHGLGVGWVSIFSPDEVKSVLDVPQSWRLVAYLCVGWPVENHDDPELERANWQERNAMTVFIR